MEQILLSIVALVIVFFIYLLLGRLSSNKNGIGKIFSKEFVRFLSSIVVTVCIILLLLKILEIMI